MINKSTEKEMREATQKASHIIAGVRNDMDVSHYRQLRDYVRWIYEFREDQHALDDFEKSVDRLERAMENNLTLKVIDERQASLMRGIHIRESAKNAAASAAWSISSVVMPFEDEPEISFKSPDDFLRTLRERKGYVEEILVEKLQQVLGDGEV
jgi:hypothetical protein